MKKSTLGIVALMLCALLSACCFTGCGKSASGSKASSASSQTAASLDGTYIVKSIDGKAPEEAVRSVAEASDMTVEEFLKQINVDAPENLVNLVLNADGTAVLDFRIFSSKQEGTWKEEGNKVNITSEGETVSFTVNGNELSNDVGDQKYVFIKK